MQKKPHRQLRMKTCFDPAAEGHVARLFLVVDTNILLTHLAVLERLREVVRAHSATETPSADEGLDDSGLDSVEVIVVVPWIVLYELDRIKTERPNNQGASEALPCAAVLFLTPIGLNRCLKHTMVLL